MNEFFKNVKYFNSTVNAQLLVIMEAEPTST